MAVTAKAEVVTPVIDDEEINALHARIAELEAQVPKAAAKIDPATLDSLPQTQIGLKESSNVRMKLMAKPMCPIDDREVIVRHINGQIVEAENPNYTGEPNCQTETASAVGWWNLCEGRNHDPYYSKKTVRREIPRFDEALLKEGRKVITGTDVEIIDQRKLNTCRVAISTRLNSGRGELYAIHLKGRKTLSAMGFREKCEFRNCELDAVYESKYGFFCGDRHARLVGADVEVVLLDIRKPKEKNKSLKTQIDPSPDGTIHLQEVPDVENNDDYVPQPGGGFAPAAAGGIKDAE